MNVLFLSLLYHPDAVGEVSGLSRTGLQNQANGFQWAMIDGIRANLAEGETLSVLNSLPVGVFPRQFKRLVLRDRTIDGRFSEIGSINLPYAKQKQRQRAAAKRIVRWAAQSPDNRTVLFYSLYLPYLGAIVTAKKKVPGLKACVIVTDLPGCLGIASGRRGILKRIEDLRGERSLRLASQMDGFIMLTEQMTGPLQVGNKKRCVIEGLISEQSVPPEPVDLPNDNRPAVLYTGTLNRELGIGLLLDAFHRLPAFQLWLCGKGDMEADVLKAQETGDNVRYFGFVPQGQAAYLQSKADALINPRTNEGEYTKYSFPSKTMEYMRSGKPVLCCKLDGIPAEYDPYLTYIEPQTVGGIQSAVRTMLSRTPKQRAEIARRAMTFVVMEKNNVRQGRRALDLLRSL